jgi:hypothetical protein
MTSDVLAADRDWGMPRAPHLDLISNVLRKPALRSIRINLNVVLLVLMSCNH